MSIEPAAASAVAVEGSFRREATRRALHAGRGARGLLWAWAAISAAVFAFAIGGSVLAVVALGLGVLGAIRAERRWAKSMATRVLADSFAAISLGRLVEAEAALDALDASSWIPVETRRLVAIQRGIVRVRRGDLPGAREALDAAIALMPERGEAEAAYQITGATAMRAFVNGALGDGEAARADIDRVRSSAAAGDDALARTSLAEALLLGRAADRDGLRALMERDRDLLYEHCHPRERAILRALDRQLHTPRQTPYRIAETRDADGDEPPVETWMARVAPHLVAFDEPRRKAPSPSVKGLAEPRPSADALAAMQANRGPRRSLGAWAVGAALFAAAGALWLVVASGPSPSPEGPISSVSAGAGGWATLAVLVTTIAIAATAASRWGARWRGRRRDRARMEATRRGAQSTSSLIELKESGDPAVAAQARLLLATEAEREGRWGDVLGETEEGLRGLSSMALRQATGLLAPDLVGLRALAFAALDRADEAEAELSTISNGYPHYPRARFRVTLVNALRRGRFDEARTTIDDLAADLPLSVREELLVDLTRSVAGRPGVSQAEAARLRSELGREATRRWVESVAPALLRTMERDVDEPATASAIGAVGPRVALGADGEGASGAVGGSEGSEEDQVAALAEAEVEAALTEELPGKEKLRIEGGNEPR